MSQSRSSTTAPRRARVLRLSEPKRALFGMLGLVMIVVGLLALFSSGNEIGTGAALIAGAVLFGLGAVGLMPLRGKAGDFGWDFVELAEAMADETGAETAARIIGPIERTLPPEVRLAAHQRLESFRNYESAVLEALLRVAGPVAKVRTNVRHPDTGRYLDAEVVFEHSRISVDIKYVTESRHAWRRAVDAIGSARLSGGRWLIVMNDVPPATVDDDQLSIVRWNTMQDDANLAAALFRVKGGPA